ncbi:MAG: hypothetical protein R2681_16560 [Pyrinomonadaceae bacterium]
MLSKIYLGILAIAVLVMTGLTFVCYSWLQSIGNPAAVVENYELYAGLSWNTLWIFFVVLIVFANVVLWKTGRSWTLWTSLLFFVVFIITQTFWLDRAFFDFQQESNLGENSLFLKPFVGITVSVLGAIGVFFDQFIVFRLRNKMFPETVADQEEIEAEEM